MAPTPMGNQVQDGGWSLRDRTWHCVPPSLRRTLRDTSPERKSTDLERGKRKAFGACLRRLVASECAVAARSRPARAPRTKQRGTMHFMHTGGGVGLIMYIYG